MSCKTMAQALTVRATACSIWFNQGIGSWNVSSQSLDLEFEGIGRSNSMVVITIVTTCFGHLYRKSGHGSKIRCEFAIILT